MAMNFLNWNTIRGPNMIAAMKFISLGFDSDSTKLSENPTSLGLFGYILCPANSVYGPWISYKQYVAIYSKSKYRMVMHNK